MCVSGLLFLYVVVVSVFSVAQVGLDSLIWFIVLTSCFVLDSVLYCLDVFQQYYLYSSMLLISLSLFCSLF